MKAIAGLAFCFGWLISFSTAAADRPVGFGAGATGGCHEARCVCHVRSPTQEALLACLATPGSGTVVFDSVAEIAIDSPAGGKRATVKIPSDKTIQGPVTLVSNGTTLEIDGQSNIVIRDVAFHSSLSDHPECKHIGSPRESARCGVAIYILGESRNIWIDHNDFTQCGEKCLEIWAQPTRGEAGGGRLVGPDLITISDNRFTNSYYGAAVGVYAQTPESELPEHERVTFYGNLFDNIFRRSPRVASHAWAHVFNNVIRDWGGRDSCVGAAKGFGPSSVGGAQMVLENNVFEAWPSRGACKAPLDLSEYGVNHGLYRGEGFARASGSATANGATIAEVGAGEVFDPRASYPYQLLPTDAVARSVKANAGARRALAETAQPQ